MLDDRVAVVTGATKGVGRGVAVELAQSGARVFVTSRSAPDREPIGERITGIRCDHRDDEQMTADMAVELKSHGVTVCFALPSPEHCLASDPHLLGHSGKVLIAASLASDYRIQVMSTGGHRGR
jgi:hypothetical protein